MCCMRLVTNTGCKNDAKNCHLRTIAQLCRAISSQLRHASTIGKKLVKQQYLPHMSLQYGELSPTSGWDRFVSLGHPSKFQRVSSLGSVTANHSTSGCHPNCGVEHATCIRLGGHHVGHWPTFLVNGCFPGKPWSAGSPQLSSFTCKRTYRDKWIFAGWMRLMRYPGHVVTS